MARRTTRSPAEPQFELYDPDDLERLKISPEVGWYLASRGIPLPTCPPKHKTPEPRDLPGARFDPERVDKVLAAFRNLQHTQGDWAGRPLTPDPWQVAYILAPVYGWVLYD
ncbi:MAG: terminase large subunit, partial [Actinocrinis sp.]